MKSTQDELAYYKKCLRDERRTMAMAQVIIPFWKLLTWLRVPGARNRYFDWDWALQSARYGNEDTIQNIDKIERYGFYPIFAVDLRGGCEVTDLKGAQEMAEADARKPKPGYDGWLDPEDAYSG